jgi:futalosine hydrolase
VNRVLVVTAVEAERAAIERGLSEEARAVTTLLVGGVGAAAVAAATAATLAGEAYGVTVGAIVGIDVVVSAGIGGAFAAAAGIGDLLVAERIIAADLGADAPEGFQSVEELGFGPTVFEALPLDGLKAAAGNDGAGFNAAGINGARFNIVRGDLLTVNTATGTAERAAWLRARHPAAVGEAMEGYGVAVAAARFGLPVAEVRAVSNLIGPRDRSAWRIGAALGVLTAAAASIVEGLAS